MATITAAHAADTEYLVRRSMTKGYQLLSLLTPPIYTAIILGRHGRGAFFINRLLRATWVGGAVGAYCSVYYYSAPGFDAFIKAVQEVDHLNTCGLPTRMKKA